MTNDNSNVKFWISEIKKSHEQWRGIRAYLLVGVITIYLITIFVSFYFNEWRFARDLGLPFVAAIMMIIASWNGFIGFRVIKKLMDEIAINGRIEIDEIESWKDK